MKTALKAYIYDGLPYKVTIAGRGFEAPRKLGKIQLLLELAKVEHEFYVKHEEGQSIDQDVSSLTVDFDRICRAPHGNK